MYTNPESSRTEARGSRPLFSQKNILLRKLLCGFALLVGCLFFAASSYALNVSFTWMANSDDPPVDGYRLYYKLGDPGQTLSDYNGTDAGGGNPSPVQISGQTTSSYVLNNLVDNQQYSFVLTAYRGTEESVPTSPIILSSSGDAATRNVSFAWAANNDDPPVDGYRLYYKTGDPGQSLADYNGTNAEGQNPSPVAILGQNTTSYLFENLLREQRYSFVLTAYRGTVESEPTDPLILEAQASVNTAPVANNAAITLDEDSSYSGFLAAVDADDDPLVYSIVAGGSSGTATITNTANGAFTYTPNPDFFGSDQFTFKVNDGTVDSNVATISVTVNNVNDQPQASNSSIIVVEDTPYSGNLPASDADDDDLYYTIVSNGAKGTVNITNTATGAFVYSPNLNATGSDSFTFKVNDGTLDSNTATVSVTILNVNDQPQASGMTISTDENTPYSGTLIASDPDDDQLQYSIVTNGSKGTAVITNSSSGAFTYTPNSGATGSDSFTFNVNDGHLDSNTATVSVTINVVNQAPQASGFAISTDENTPYSGTLIASDPDEDPLQYSIVSNASKGTAAITGSSTGAFTYTPNSGATGSDSFTFKVNDGSIDSNTATVSVTISSVNQAPLATGFAISTDENTPYSGTLIASDPDEDPLQYSIVSNASKGTAAITGSSTGAFTYTPNSGASGSDSFTFKVNDGNLDSNTATVSVTISSVNQAPLATGFAISTNANTSYSGTLTASDPDDDTLQFSIVSNGSKGTAAITDSATGGFTYTPNTDETGNDSFTFRVYDGELYSAAATVAVTIVEVNTAPVAHDASFSMEENTALNGRFSASDADGDPLTYTLVTNPTKGSVTIADPAADGFVYTPVPDTTGNDTFTFRVNDGTEDSNTATVSITIYEADVSIATFGDADVTDHPGTLAETFTNVNTDINADREIISVYSWSATLPHKVANTIIVKANLSVLPYYARIIQAELQLYQTGANGAGEYTTTVHRITGKNPVISQVNGYNAYNGEPWTPVPAGTTYNDIPLGLADIGSAESTTLLNSENGFRSWDVTDMVQAWVRDPEVNYGLLLNGQQTTVETGRTFASSLSEIPAARPRLIVRYSTQPLPPQIIMVEEIK
jgi:VCBS repeat-containing protein